MNNLAAIQSSNNLVPLPGDYISPVAMMNDGAMMDRMIKFAEIMATGKATIPNELRNVGDCLAITIQAMTWGMSPFSLAQKTHFIGGKIGYEAQAVAAAINGSGAVKDTFHFDWFGPWEKVIGKFEIKRGDKGEYRIPGWKMADEDGIGVKVWATLRAEHEPRELTLLLAQARTRNSTLWADDPRQQLAYLAQKRWARLYAPGVLLGVYTPDELADPMERDMGAAEVVEEAKPAGNTRTEALKSHLGAGKKKPAVTLEQVITGLNAANSPEELLAAAEQAKALSNDDKAKAGAAYTARLHELKAAAQNVDRSTGEVIDPDDAALKQVEQTSGMTYAEVASALEKADSRDDFDAACDLIQHVQSITQRDELSGIVKRRLAEFKAQ